MRWLLAGALSLCLLGACTTIASYDGTTETRVVDNISGSRIYIYSFLSPARQAIGAHVLNVFDHRLTESLAEHSIATEFGASSQTAFPNVRPNGFGTFQMRLPINETIAENSAREAEFGATYRLIIAPRFFSDTPNSGDGGSYKVTWMLVEIASNEIVWSTEMNGAYTPIIYDNERADERASIIVNGAIAQMHQSGLF